MTYKHNPETQITFKCECATELSTLWGKDVTCFNCGRVYKASLVEIEHERLQPIDHNLTDQAIHKAVINMSEYAVRRSLQEMLIMIRDNKLSPQPIEAIYLPYVLWKALTKNET